MFALTARCYQSKLQTLTHEITPEGSVAPFTITPNDPLGDFVLCPSPSLNLGSSGSEVMVSKGGIFFAMGKAKSH